MLQFLRSEKQFLFVLLFWSVVGVLFAPLTWVVIPVTLMLFQRKKMYAEMLMGFFVTLILSDSRQYSFHYAGDIKDIYLLLLAFFFFTDKQTFAPAERLFFRFLPFIIIAFFFLLFGDIILKSAQKTLSYLLLLLVTPNYLSAIWRSQGKEGMRKLVWTGVFVLGVGFVFRFISPAFVTLAGRYCGMLGNPNGLGLFCIVFFIFVAVVNEIRSDMFSRKEIYLIYAVILLSTALSGSRNAIFTIGIFVVFHYCYKISPFLGIFVFLIMILVYQLILANLANIIVGLNLQEYFRLETLENASGRLVAWQFGWEKISENPMLGHGIGYTDYYYRQNYDLLSIRGHQGNAHNSYITFWIDTGLLGLLFYLVAFIRSFVSGAKRFPAAVPAMFAIMFSAFFESWLTASLNPFTIQCVFVMTIIASPVFLTDPFEESAEESADEELEEEESGDSPMELQHEE